MALSGGTGNPTPRPSSQSPGKQRKKYDTNTKGRDKAKEVRPRAVEGAAGTLATVESSGTVTRSQMITLPTHAPSHRKRKDDPNRSVTPYPRGRSGSR